MGLTIVLMMIRIKVIYRIAIRMGIVVIFKHNNIVTYGHIPKKCFDEETYF